MYIKQKTLLINSKKGNSLKITYIMTTIIIKLTFYINTE